MPLTRGRSVRFDGYLHRDSIGAAPSGAAPNIFGCTAPAAVPAISCHFRVMRSALRRRSPPKSQKLTGLHDPLSEHGSSHPESSAYVADLTRDRRADAAAPLP